MQLWPYTLAHASSFGVTENSQPVQRLGAFAKLATSYGEGSLRYVLNEHVAHYHYERNHQGQGNGMLCPTPNADGEAEGPIQCRERLGGLLKYYERKAA
jgi:hypothetical protein